MDEQFDKTVITLSPIKPDVLAEEGAADYTQARNGHRTADFESLGISSKYEILEQVGEGGMCIVYKARHRVLQHVLAIKFMQGHLIRDSVQVKRFLQEAQALYKLDHPNIVSVRDSDFTGEGKPYLVMDFLEGISLSDQIKRSYSLAVPRALNLFMQACDGLEHAHKNGIVHRDIKPSNIVLVKSADGVETVKIVDFGIAKLDQPDTEAQKGLTQTGEVFGSPLYMSPEQCLGGQLDARSDIYSFGCVMYETLTGKPPFDGEHALVIIQSHVNDTPEPVNIPNCSPVLSQRLDQIIFKAMEKDASKRYQSMAELKADLQELAETSNYKGNLTGTYVRYARVHRRFAKWIRTNPMKFAGACLSIACLIAVGIFGSWFVAARCLPLADAPQAIPMPDWTFEPATVLTKPANYNDRYIKAHFVVEEGADRSGHGQEDTIKMRNNLAGWCIKYGDWHDAGTQLQKIVPFYQLKYGPSDFETLFAQTQLGLCQYRLGLYEDAAKNFDQASKIAEPSMNRYGDYDRFYKPNVLRLANCLLHLNQYEEALPKYNVVMTNNEYSAEVAMAHAGRADCDMKSYNASHKAAFAEDALYQYLLAEQAWEKALPKSPELSPNISICERGRVNASIALNKYANAAKIMDALVGGKDGKDLLLDERFRKSYAQVLWHAGRYFEALGLER